MKYNNQLSKYLSKPGEKPEIMLKRNSAKDVPKKPKYRNLVISGGSIRGICHVGALQKLVDVGLIDLRHLKAIAGSSAGAMLGCLIVLGFTTEEIWEFLKSIDFSKLVNPNFMLFFKNCGIESGQVMYALMEDILHRKTGINKVTFRQLYETTKIKFIVVGSCLTTKETVYFDYLNTPDFSVSLAIRISISMPGFFVPVIIDGKKYVDGAILNNYAMNLFKDELDETIGILLYTGYETDYQYPEEFFMAIINLFMHNYYHERVKEYQNNTIYVTKHINEKSVFDFSLDQETKMKLYQAGVSATVDFLKLHHPSFV